MKVTFIDPLDATKKTEVDVPEHTKILQAARKGKVVIRYGCAACRCGTCAVKVSDKMALLPMAQDERDLLEKMSLTSDGTIRLSCRGLVIADLAVDLSFQDQYEPV